MKKTPLVEGSLYLSLIRSIRYVANRTLCAFVHPIWRAQWKVLLFIISIAKVVIYRSLIDSKHPIQEFEQKPSIISR
ncbi:hypothetical protein [Clostridium sp. 1xD42-85]|uniref:hypothetical protein n=1 Tax=Clostridium sp. 1xD42-85 TaxID=2320084 RepID=UPI0016022CBC|nr:hypothetical protein [Clostridium sp. 1xD42-85]